MNFGKVKKQDRDLLRVYDDGGSISSGEEAIEIWRNQFAKGMGGDNGDRETSGCQMDRKENGVSSINGCVNPSLERRCI